MMQRAAFLLIKWLVVPAGLAVVGYYVLGPMISQGAMPGSRTVKKLAGQVGVAPATPAAPKDPLAAPVEEGPRFPEPEIDLTVEDQGRVRWSAGGNDSGSTSVRRRREARPDRPYRPRESRPAPSENEPAPEPTPDEAAPTEPPPADSASDTAGAGGADPATPPPTESAPE